MFNFQELFLHLIRTIMYHGFPRCSFEVAPQTGHFEIFFIEYNIPHPPHATNIANGATIYLVRTQFHI